MENPESGQVPLCEHGDCFVCKFSHGMHSLRNSGSKVWHSTSQKARSGVLEAGHSFQQRMPKTSEFIQTTCHKIGDSSRSAYTTVRPTLEGWGESAVQYGRDLKIFMNLATSNVFLCIFYASMSVLIGLCLFHLAQAEISADILLAALVMIVVSVLLPVYLLRSGLMSRITLAARQETHQSTATLAKTDENLPQYGSLVFSISDDEDHVAPPAYEEVVCVNGDTHDLPSAQRSGPNITTSVCPVHQHQSIARHTDVIQDPTPQPSMMPPRSRSMGELRTVDTEPLLA